MIGRIFLLLALCTAGAVAEEAPLEILIGEFPNRPDETAFRKIEKMLETPDAAKTLPGGTLAAAVFLGRAAKANGWEVRGSGDVCKLGARIATDGRRVNAYLENEQQLDRRKIDLRWAEYFATGDTSYLDKILPFAGRAYPKDDAKLAGVLGVANGSFKMNSGRFPWVEEYVKRCLADPQEKDKAEFLRECVAQGPVTKIVSRNIGPKIDPESFAAKPKTFFRSGSQFMRIEEELDPAMNLKGLLVSNGRDCWMINLQTASGRHIMDPGPTYESFSPLAPSEGKGTRPRVKEFQMGAEREFMKSRGAKPAPAKFQGKEVTVYEAWEEGLGLRLYVDPASSQPVGVSVSEGEGTLSEIVYESYETGLPFDRALFLPPPGISVSEVLLEGKSK